MTIETLLPLFPKLDAWEALKKAQQKLPLVFERPPGPITRDKDKSPYEKLSEQQKLPLAFERPPITEGKEKTPYEKLSEINSKHMYGILPHEVEQLPPAKEKSIHSMTDEEYEEYGDDSYEPEKIKPQDINESNIDEFKGNFHHKLRGILNNIRDSVDKTYASKNKKKYKLLEQLLNVNQDTGRRGMYQDEYMNLHHIKPQTPYSLTKILSLLPYFKDELKWGGHKYEIEELRDIFLPALHELGRLPSSAYQTELGQHHPTLPGTYSNQPLTMVRVIPESWDTETERYPKGETRSAYQSILSQGIEPVSSQHGGFENTSVSGTTRLFPLESHPRYGPGGEKERVPGGWYTAPVMRDLRNLNTGDSYPGGSLIGIRDVLPQEGKAFIRKPTESKEELHEIYYQEHIDPKRIVNLTPSLIPSGRGDESPTTKLESIFRGYQPIHTMVRSGLDPKTLQPRTYGGHDIKDVLEYLEKDPNVPREPLIDLNTGQPINRKDAMQEIYHDLMGRLDPKDTINEGDISYLQDNLIDSRNIINFLQTSGINLLQEENPNFSKVGWPMHPSGEHYNINDAINVSYNVGTALRTTQRSQAKIRNPLYGKEGEEHTLQPPLPIEIAHLGFAQSSYEVGDAFNLYNNPVFREGLKIIRQHPDFNRKNWNALDTNGVLPHHTDKTFDFDNPTGGYGTTYTAWNHPQIFNQLKNIGLHNEDGFQFDRTAVEGDDYMDLGYTSGIVSGEFE